MTSSVSLWRLTVVFCVLAILSIGFQNCTQQFEVKNMVDSASLASSTTLAPLPAAVNNCNDPSTFDACLFTKSPVAQTGRVVTDAELSNTQKTGVRLPSLTNADQLASADFSVINRAGSVLTSSATSNQWRSTYRQNPEINLGASSYYYIQSFKNWMKSLSGSTSLDGRNIKIIPFSEESGYFHSAKEIRLIESADRIPMALDATSSVGFATQALIAYESAGRSLVNASASTNECLNAKGLPSAKACCKTKDLCGPAISQGASDFLTSLYFLSLGSTTLGETWVNSPEGLQHCGINRNPASNSSLTTDAAYQACASRSSPGYVYTMGSLYSSVWWEARKKSTNPADFDLFFLRHLSLIYGDDNWNSLKLKLVNLANSQSRFNESYRLLVQEANRRGLP